MEFQQASLSRSICHLALTPRNYFHESFCTVPVKTKASLFLQRARFLWSHGSVWSFLKEITQRQIEVNWKLCPCLWPSGWLVRVVWKCFRVFTWLSFLPDHEWHTLATLTSRIFGWLEEYLPGIYLVPGDSEWGGSYMRDFARISCQNTQRVTPQMPWINSVKHSRGL